MCKLGNVFSESDDPEDEWTMLAGGMKVGTIDENAWEVGRARRGSQS